MKKLTLALDNLTVDSFSTTAVNAAPRGTVQGHDDTIESEWCTTPKTCSQPPCDTLEHTCSTC